MATAEATIENVSSLQEWISRQEEDDKSQLEFDVKTIPFQPDSEYNSVEKIRRTPVSDYGDTAFILEEVLSHSECETIIRLSESIGFEKIRGLKESYRSCDRIVVLSEDLASVIWQRVSPFLCQLKVPQDPGDVFVHGIPQLIKGSWTASDINPLFRVCRYEPGEHFGPHFDGHLVRSISCRSFQTIMIYLNNVPATSGGATTFISNNQGLHEDGKGRFCAEAENYLESIAPQTGRAIVFNHHRLHQGTALEEGSKYILRSDVMFNRDSPPTMTADQEEGVRQLQQAERLEGRGLNDEAVNCYRRAFKLYPDLEKWT